jgi:hypothetical protein
MIANLGSGALYIVCWLMDVGFADDLVQAARATYEYGNTFLLIAGLLNYLTMLMPLISQLGGNRETFPGDDGFRRAFVNSVWLCSQGYSAREMSVRMKVFAEFMVIGLALGWILYFIP